LSAALKPLRLRQHPTRRALAVARKPKEEDETYVFPTLISVEEKPSTDGLPKKKSLDERLRALELHLEDDDESVERFDRKRSGTPYKIANLPVVRQPSRSNRRLSTARSGDSSSDDSIQERHSSGTSWLESAYNIVVDGVVEDESSTDEYSDNTFDSNPEEASDDGQNSVGFYYKAIFGQDREDFSDADGGTLTGDDDGALTDDGSLTDDGTLEAEGVFAGRPTFSDGLSFTDEGASTDDSGSQADPFSHLEDTDDEQDDDGNGTDTDVSLQMFQYQEGRYLVVI
jgi:hypothetical protein